MTRRHLTPTPAILVVSRPYRGTERPRSATWRRATWRRATWRRAGVAVLALMVALAGCTGGGSDPGDAPDGGTADEQAATSPLAECTTLTDPPPDATPADADASGHESESLPEITLPCLTGDEPVAMDELAGPAVVNLWASWCRPCRRELPVLQDFADRHGGAVHVVGVITEDRRTNAAAFADATGVTFPGLFDRDGEVRAAVAAFGLPVTLFVDADGRVRHTQNLEMDASTLADLAAEHLGVTPS